MKGGIRTALVSQEFNGLYPSISCQLGYTCYGPGQCEYLQLDIVHRACGLRPGLPAGFDVAPEGGDLSRSA